MIAFFHSQELFPTREAAQKETAVFLLTNKNALVQNLNLENAAHLENLVNTLKSASFFKEKKLVVATNIFFNNKISTEVHAEVKKYFVKPDPDLSLIFCNQGSTEELKKKDKNLYGLLSKYSQRYGELQPLKGIRLEKWLSEKFKTAGLKIKTSALKNLLFSVSSQERLCQEADKLIAYKSYGKNKTGNEVSNEDIKALVTPDFSFNNFSLTDALAQKNKLKAVTLFGQYLSESGDAGAILGLFAYQIRVLLKIKSLLKESVPYAKLPSLTKLHPFVIKKAYENSRNFELDELKRMHTEIARLDKEFKDGCNDLPTSLFCLILGIK